MFKRLLEKKGICDVALLTVLWVTAIWVIHPSGNFPLNDDFSYSRTVLNLLQSGKYIPTQWPGMTLLAHVLWGALFCIPFGFSFNALRFSVCVLGLAGTIVTYLVFRTVRAPRSVSFLGAILLAFNPVYLTLSNTFMTDVTFTTLSMSAILLSIRQLEKDSNRSWIFLSVLSVVTVLCRQFGLFIPLAYGIAHTIRYGFSRRSLRRGWIPFLLALSVLVVYQAWMRTKGIVPAYLPMMKALVSHGIGWELQFLLENILYFLVYLGLFLFPWLIVFSRNRETAHTKRDMFERAGLYLLPLLISFYLIWNHRLMPFRYNILNDWGIGPSNLRDTDILYIPHLHILSWHFWVLATVAGVVGGAMLLRHAFRSGRRLWSSIQMKQTNDQTAWLVFISCSVAFYVLMMIWTNFFDRYAVPVIPQTALLIFLSRGGMDSRPSIPNRSVLVASFILCGFSAAFSVAGVRDYLSVNRIRWSLLRNLVEEQAVSPAKIDGGFEFNGWYLYDDHYREKADKSWWWVEDDEYVVSMGPMEGYDVIRREEFLRWQALKRDAVYLLHRKESS